MSTVNENNPWNRLNTCPACGHYTTSHNGQGCVVIENKYDRSSGWPVWKETGPCDCKLPGPHTVLRRCTESTHE